MLSGLCAISRSANQNPNSSLKGNIPNNNNNNSYIKEAVSIAKQTQLPVVVGGVSQCRSIWATARFHSFMSALASWATLAWSGVRLPHMAGLDAIIAACLAIKRLFIGFACQ
jgi:hypothetical protein